MSNERKRYVVVNSPESAGQKEIKISHNPLRSLDGSLTVVKYNKNLHGSNPVKITSGGNVSKGPYTNEQVLSYLRSNAALYRERLV